MSEPKAAAGLDSTLFMASSAPEMDRWIDGDGE